MNFIVNNIKQILGLLDPDVALLRGKEMAVLNGISNAWLQVKDHKIAAFE